MQSHHNFDLPKLLELQAKIASSMSELNAMSPSAARQLIQQLAEWVGAATKTAPAGASGRSRESSEVFDKIAAVFLANGNAAMTKEQIVEKAGITEGSLHTALYTTRPDSFMRKPSPAGGKARVICLKPTAIEEAKRKRKEATGE
jgi:hypothetical protein